jgi:aryl-alcohol dehydrogenase-like predicted oxidoreductase
LILGTAQLGLNYGISNQKGQPSIDQARLLLQSAKDLGINLLDTAFAYGNSEQIIGDIQINELEVISKMPDLSNLYQSKNSENLSQYIDNSLKNTKQKKLHAYLLHTVDNLDYGGLSIWNKMLEFKDLGLTKKIGYSLYRPAQLDLYFDRFKPDVVQIPMNIIDRQFLKSGWLKKLKDHGVEIHVRSVFLQGLLLMDLNSQLKRFPTYEKVWKLFSDELKNSNSSALTYCLSFVKGIEEVDEIVVGVNSKDELQEIMSSKLVNTNSPIELSSEDEELIYPFNWK